MATTLLDSTLCDVFLANRAQLWRVAQKILRKADWADEVVQDAYLKLVDGASAAHVRQPLSYCCQVVRNLAFDYFRHHAVEATYRSFGEAVELIEVPGGPTPEQGIDERKLLARIDQALDALPPRTRQAFELYRLGGMTQRDIGARLGCSATLVNFMVKDAMAALEGCRDLLG